MTEEVSSRSRAYAESIISNVDMSVTGSSRERAEELRNDLAEARNRVAQPDEKRAHATVRPTARSIPS